MAGPVARLGLFLACVGLGGAVVPRPLGLRAASVRTVEATKDQGFRNIFGVLMREWQDIPEKEGFVKNCTETLTKVLPQLRREYTARNVPDILFHECDIHSLATTFQINGSKLEDARRTCRASARRLASEFMGAKDYAGWCDDVHVDLEKDAHRMSQADESERLRQERDAAKAELDALKKTHKVDGKADQAVVGEALAKGFENGVTDTVGEGAKEIMHHLDDLAQGTFIPKGNEPKEQQCCPADCRICDL